MGKKKKAAKELSICERGNMTRTYETDVLIPSLCEERVQYRNCLKCREIGRRVKGCEGGCCDDYRCEKCNYDWRVEWPD